MDERRVRERGQGERTWREGEEDREGGKQGEGWGWEGKGKGGNGAATAHHTPCKDRL